MSQDYPVIIIGSGPAGLLLAQLLYQDGISSVILERQSREHVEGRIRAGVLEEGSVSVLRQAGISRRMFAEGQYHSGFKIVFDDDVLRIDMEELSGKRVMVYGQTEITRDLISKNLDSGIKIVFEAGDVSIRQNARSGSTVSYTSKGKDIELNGRFVAGCDGYHGPSRQSIPVKVRKEYEKVFPFGWLGILSETPPVSMEIVYCNAVDGFALASLRNEMLSRYYVQVPVSDEISHWSDERFWDCFQKRLGNKTRSDLVTGPSIEKSIAPLRSFVCEPMQHNSLFLAGDAAHIVPPTGAKGLNLAVGDVYYLHKAMVRYFENGDTTGLDGYSELALARVWKSVRFSWWFTHLLHDLGEDRALARKLQRAEFEHIAQSRTAAANIAENYAGLPY